jgi:hypothetical protein
MCELFILVHMTIGGNQTNNLISDRHRLLIIVMKNRYLKFISLVFQREKKWISNTVVIPVYGSSHCLLEIFFNTFNEHVLGKK